ncbi:CAP domain-containing protein [Streptomyces decoyicus]|uniref:CAP domain-containing protein n=1 Tax=Streptomyces decoyicus TaxID=249567 RepID=UPI00099C8661|nr:CAP domain-containing protein [Streptomyces decoyicus]QZY19769.1 CAP domain-containing protein [Streptomyces decoyicus]
MNTKYSSPFVRDPRGADRREARIVPLGIVISAGALIGVLALLSSQADANATEYTGSPAPASASSAAGKPAAQEDTKRAARYEAKVLRLVNKARAEHGCGPLRRDARLAKAARLHSQDMSARHYYARSSPDGRDPKERMEAQGYKDAHAENIDAWETEPEGAFRAWMNSPGHRANILSCSSHATGVGVAFGGKLRAHWTQDFGYK